MGVSVVVNISKGPDMESENTTSTQFEIGVKMFGFQIIVKSKVTKDTTIEEIKKDIFEKTGIKTADSILLVNGKSLDDKEAVSRFLSLSNNDDELLELRSKKNQNKSNKIFQPEEARDTFDITVIDQTNEEEFIIEVKRETSVLNIKQKVSMMNNFPTTDMVLLLEDFKLVDTEVVGFYEIETGDEIQLLVFQE